MIRVVASAFGFAILVSVLTHGNQVAVEIAFFVALAAIVIPLLAGATVLKCRYCRKRVKLGATACHHCGRATARTAA